MSIAVRNREVSLMIRLFRQFESSYIPRTSLERSRNYKLASRAGFAFGPSFDSFPLAGDIEELHPFLRTDDNNARYNGVTVRIHNLPVAVRHPITANDSCDLHQLKCTVVKQLVLMVAEDDAFALQSRNRYLRALEDDRDWSSTTFRHIERGLCLRNWNCNGQNKDSYKTPSTKIPFSLFCCYHGRFLLSDHLRNCDYIRIY